MRYAPCPDFSASGAGQNLNSILIATTLLPGHRLSRLLIQVSLFYLGIGPWGDWVWSSAELFISWP